MLKAGVRKCVYFYFREEIKKNLKGSLLCFGTLPVSALMERQTPCSLPGAAAGFQSWRHDHTWKKNTGILLGIVLVLLSCLSVPPRMGILSQRGQKICFGVCCLSTPHGCVWVLFRTFLCFSLDYVIFIELSAYWCRSAHLSSWGAPLSAVRGQN